MVPPHHIASANKAVVSSARQEKANA